jgi:hypothetical protein
MSDLSFEVTEFFQDKRMRFNAALKMMEILFKDGVGFPDCIDKGIERADELIEKLEETEK